VADLFVWDTRSARYRDPVHGRFVSRQAVKAAVEQVIDGARQELHSHTQRLAAGVLNLPTWQTECAQTLRALHLASAVIGKGGRAQMTPADYGRIGARTKDQYGFLARMAGEIHSGAIDLADEPATLRRIGLYADAARATYEQSSRDSASTSAVLSWERNVLGTADHCDECLAATASGRVPIGTLPLPGQRVCKQGCKCSLVYG
jgi:hypothetical protein